MCVRSAFSSVDVLSFGDRPIAAPRSREVSATLGVSVYPHFDRVFVKNHFGSCSADLLGSSYPQYPWFCCWLGSKNAGSTRSAKYVARHVRFSRTIFQTSLGGFPVRNTRWTLTVRGGLKGIFKMMTGSTCSSHCQSRCRVCGCSVPAFSASVGRSLGSVVLVPLRKPLLYFKASMFFQCPVTLVNPRRFHFVKFNVSVSDQDGQALLSQPFAPRPFSLTGGKMDSSVAHSVVCQPYRPFDCFLKAYVEEGVCVSTEREIASRFLTISESAPSFSTKKTLLSTSTCTPPLSEPLKTERVHQFEACEEKADNPPRQSAKLPNH